MNLATRQAIRRMFHCYNKASEEGLVYQTVSFRRELPGKRILIVSGQDLPTTGVRSSFTANCQELAAEGEPAWELVIGARHDRDLTADLAKVATFLTWQAQAPRPGTLMSDVFGEPEERGTLPFPHAVLVKPEAWKPLMEINQRASEAQFRFLQVLPLTTPEWELARSRGLRALESELERSGRDVFDLGQRRSNPPPIPDWAKVDGVR